MGIVGGRFDRSRSRPCERAVAELLVATSGEVLPPLARGELGEIGDAVACEEVGVDIYNDPEVAEDAMEEDLLVLAGP